MMCPKDLLLSLASLPLTWRRRALGLRLFTAEDRLLLLLLLLVRLRLAPVALPWLSPDPPMYVAVPSPYFRQATTFH